MSRQWASYSLRDGDKPPTPETEIRFGYDPTRPALPVAVIFPEGNKVLTQDQLAEIGVLCLAIAGKVRTGRTEELCAGFEVEPPAFVKPPPKAVDLAREIVKAFVDTFEDVRRQYGANPAARREVEAGIARIISKGMT
jgi:hypothetical protein